MAYIATQITAPLSLSKTLNTPFIALGSFLMFLAKANSHAQRLEQVNTLTDTQLSDIGATREDIVRHAFRDCLYV